jgi:saccharopine dehydrogenase (NAD+, L-lysine-forming)
MDKTIKAGILRETKNPPDRRVPLTPAQIIALEELYPFLQFYVQPSDFRCYSDDEYEYLNIPLMEDLHDCDILLGIKEVDKQTLLPEKTYMFFAHVAKKQSYNREMFREMVDKKVSLIDYEYLTKENGERVVAFGRWAGIVGAYNALRARGIRTNMFELKPAHQCHDLEEMWAGLRLIELKPDLKILVTGNGRVAKGALETLSNCSNIVQVEPDEYLNRIYEVPVVCQIGPEHYTRSKSNQKFSFSHFVNNPDKYESAFHPYTRVTDILITGHYWDPSSPVFFTKEDMKTDDFRISIIADISCDIKGPIPSTLRPTTIDDPFYGYNPVLDKEEPSFMRPGNITVMSIDNLPGELPRDASLDFGRQLMRSTLYDLFAKSESPVIERATILKNGQLTQGFSYLRDYLTG